MRLPALALALALAACGAQDPEPAGAPAAPRTQSQLDDDPRKAGRTHVSFSFDELDLNDDGSIARTESAFDAALSESFDSFDKDRDGGLSRLEFDVARAAQDAARGSLAPRQNRPGKRGERDEVEHRRRGV